MGTETDNDGLQSAPGKPEFSGSNIIVPTNETDLDSPKSQVSPNSKTNSHGESSLAEANSRPVNTEMDETTVQADIHDTLKDTNDLDRPTQPNNGTLEDKKLMRRPRKFNINGSDESDESDESDGIDFNTLSRLYGSKTLFAAYQASVEMESTLEKRSEAQGSILVRGLMDYLGVLEARMEKLEANTDLKRAPEKNEKDNRPKPVDDDDTIILDARFFNSADHIKENNYLGVHDGTQRGTYMCDRDPKYLIRVLYSWVNEDMGLPSENAISEPPHANDIDILTFGVQSRPIAQFFQLGLGIKDELDHIIRFEKPFKAVIRNISRFRKQLLKLENKFGSGTENVQQCQPSMPEADVDREESDPLLFDQPAALPHFQTFVTFVDKYLGKQIKLFDRLREAKEDYVAFENLWMLFDSKDTIYCPLREVGQDEKFENIPLPGGSPEHRPIRRYTPQAYRVLATAGGTLFSASATTAKRKVVNASVAPTTVDLTDAQILLEANAPLGSISRSIRSNYAELHVYCFYADFNGVNYGTRGEVFVFKPYEGELDIRSLQAYPIEYATENKLSDRGKKFLQLTKVSHKQYEGFTTGSNRQEINSPVIVDVRFAFEGLEEQSIEVPKFNPPSDLWLKGSYTGVCDVMGKPQCSNPWCYEKSCVINVYHQAQGKERNSIISETKLILEEYETLKQRGSAGRKRFQQLMERGDLVRLLPGAVPGFALRNRRWVLLDINLVKDVEQNSEWKNLFLPPGHQEMVQAMVETYRSDKEGTRGMDLVRGKGKGCIILLHGVPGVGKTSTAECVAAHTKKPLYPITCGDIGYNAEDVERNMETHFKLAHRWGCVLLLDEADVFLAKRDQKDVQRNGLVSVFLRILEYYSGILFLTTNRVGAIDDAFRSRLHLTLYYPKLTKDQTNSIFTNNFDRIADINTEREEKELPPFEYIDTKNEILKWAKKNYRTLGWNGRQIRNAFQTVLALSEFHSGRKKNKSKNQDNPVVKLKYFMVVANAATQFNEYLKATHGYDEERVAKRDFIRAVEFTPKFSPLLSETEDSSEQNSDEDDSSESDSGQSRNEEDQDHSSGFGSDHEKIKKKRTDSKAKKESSSKSAAKKGKKAKDDNAKPKKSKDKKKDKKKEDTNDSE